ncbi:hypothetical protein INT48_008282 [Thamnidium elegans]|uniref:Ras guanine nucleotide exchange factor n=1 Tax=Thamnidium elegans TaxID=101142 RepID=A0A8H7SIH7_9FUNG|nr:hypothetical protein INT48_008282 [Thamnidium elegans]
MWLSRKISSIIKQKSLLHSSSTTFKKQVSFVLAVISGVNNTGKSTLIKCLGLQELKYDIHRQLYRLKNNEQFIIQVIEYNGIPPNLELLDGVFICYDTTNRDSMDHLPDIINVFVSQHVPCLLIGLKSDLTVQRTVDPQLGHLIGNLFGVQAIEADNITHQGIQLLQKCFIQFIYSDRKILLQSQQQGMTDPIIITPPSTCSSHSNSPIISRSSSCSTSTTGGDTVSTIVDQVLANHHDEHIVIIFLTMFRKFMKPLDLVNILIQRFELDLIQNDDTPLIIPTIRQERIRSFFCLWLSQYWGDFKRDVLLPLAVREAAIYDKDIWGIDSFGAWTQHENDIKKRPTIKARLLSSSLRRAASTNSHQRLPVSFKSILSFTTHNHHDNNRRNSTPPISSSSSSNNTGLSYCPAIFGGGLISIQHQTLNDSFETITCFSPAQFAEQFTCIEAELFRKIQPRDFLRHLWIQKKKQHHNKNPVLASIEHFNFISAWIASLVVNQPLLERRVVLFEICLQIAVELKRLNNFNTLMAVLAGVNNAAVLRLKRTRELTRVKNKALYEEFLALELLMSSERSFSNYRSTLKQTELPGIPYLGIHQQDLVSLGEANKDHKMDGKVHWNKFRLMGESILEMMRFQYPTYHLLESNPFLLYFIGHQTVSTEDELYEKSKEIEPRHNMSSLSTSSSTSSRWLTSLK